MDKKIILALVIGGLILWPRFAMADAGKGKPSEIRTEQKTEIQAHREQQEAENKAFRETLKNMTPEQLDAAIDAHQEQQFQENIAFRNQLHQKNMTELRAKLAQDKKLTEEQKQKILSEREQQFQAEMQRWTQRHAEMKAAIDKIKKDPSLTPEQKQEKIKEYLESIREGNKEHRQEIQGQNKALKETMMGQKENSGK